MLLILYLTGAAFQVMFTVKFEGNSTLALAALRVVVWPVYWSTGRPHGVPLTSSCDDDECG